MSFIEQVLGRTVVIERLLVGNGGKGMGLRELSESIRSKLGEELYQQIRSIGTVRNGLAHEHGYRYQGNEYEFLRGCDRVVSALKGLEDFTGNSQKNTSGSRNQRGFTMTLKDNNPWVAPQGFSYGSDYPSSVENRLVFISGGSVDVKAPNTSHSAGYGWPLQWLNPHRIDSIAFVKMTFGFVEVMDEGNIVTKDQVPLNLALKLKLQVADTLEAIARVVLNTAQEVEDTATKAVEAFRKIAGEHNYRELMQTQATLTGTAKTILAGDSAFSIQDIILVSIGSTITKIGDQFIVSATASIDHNEMQKQLETERLAQDLEDEKHNRERQRKLAELIPKADLAAKPGGLEVINPELAKEKYRLEAEIEKAVRTRDDQTDRLRMRLEEQEKANRHQHTIYTK